VFADVSVRAEVLCLEYAPLGQSGSAAIELQLALERKRGIMIGQKSGWRKRRRYLLERRISAVIGQKGPQHHLSQRLWLQAEFAIHRAPNRCLPPRYTELHLGVMAPIEFSVKVTENDIARLYDEVRPYWRALIPIAYIAIVLGIGGVFMGPDSWPVAGAIIAGGLCVVLVPRGFKALLVRQFRKNPARSEQYDMSSKTIRSR
jgi:hypothetical protein